MTSSGLIVLSSEAFSAALAPAAGGSLAFWREKTATGDIDLMRPASEKALAEKKAEDSAMYPLVPYSNRILGGSFIYWGIRRKVPQNHPAVPHPLHGEGWKTCWNVDYQGENRAVLSFSHDGKKGFPFAYFAQNTFTLEGSVLTVLMKLTNKGAIPMPCGLGLHPFFPKDDDTLVTFRNRTLWATNTDTVFEKPIKPPPESQFSNGIRIAKVFLDDCFGGCDGRAEMVWPSRKLKINISAQSDFNHMVVWSPKGEDFFCIEPVTNTTDAFNLASHGITGTGVKTLAPEESLTEKIAFTVTHLD